MTDKLISNAVRIRDQLIARSALTGREAILGAALKVGEEAGELAEAVLGVYGQNPRKGVHKTRDDVLTEAIDVLLTAAVLGVWIEGDESFAARIDERLDFLADRAEEGWEEGRLGEPCVWHRDDGGGFDPTCLDCVPDGKPT